MKNCEYANITGNKLERFITCSVSGKFCKYQRYCIEKKEVLNTDNYPECKILKEKSMATKTKNNTSTKDTKGKYKVVLVASNYIVYEKDGNTIFKNGHFDVKIGDYIDE